MNEVVFFKEDSFFSLKVRHVQNLKKFGVREGHILVCKKINTIPDTGIYIIEQNGELLAIQGDFEKLNGVLYYTDDSGATFQYKDLKNIVGVAIGGFYKVA